MEEYVHLIQILSYKHGKLKKEMTLEPKGKSFWIGHRPERTNRSPAEIFLRTSMKSPTPMSAQSSERIFPALVMEMPRRRHSGRSIWLRPTVVATTSCREGRWRRMSEVMGELLEETTALTEWAWVVRKRVVGSGDSHALSNWNFGENLYWKSENNEGGLRMRSCGRASSSAAIDMVLRRGLKTDTAAKFINHDGKSLLRMDCLLPCVTELTHSPLS